MIPVLPARSNQTAQADTAYTCVIEEDKRAVDVADQRQQPPSMVLNHGLAYDSIQTQPYSQNLLSMNLLEPDGHHNYTQMDHQTALQLV
ncbi:hypothetical protein SAY86_016730 [Trapa natans]|uniref:Uncharacterized protein n=1 Tax=Trapa natans TaxID=22666 RepID=A0AAN7M446_TRANT|nr:hypothetical protein SAY86_016730 [Trapa natans]